jgi:hypothetical protein
MSTKGHQRTHAAQPDGLLDHLIGAGEQCRRHGESQCFCGLEVDYQEEFHWPPDRQVGGFRAI